MSNDENQVHGGAGSVGGGGEEGAGGEGGSLRAAFELALSMSGTERAAYLERVGAGDFARRVQLEEMLRAAESDPTFLSSPTGAPTANVGEQTRERRSAPLLERPGTKIGLYKLLQHIGEGGFGTVFLAEQDKPVRRRVALKILKLGMDTKSIIARFEAERQALALMDHPHIARVLDAGATESGRPFFVMEYVVGDAITRFADAHKLGVQDRLALFQQVCQAVQHAHTKGVIHRDLKPGNVLVSMSDGKPFAKVIDFGIAKATSQPLTDKTLFTEHRQLLGTPEYMSPEQADGSPDIDTRTDVYALGVLLYELLTGATPFDAKRLRSAAYAEMQRIIKEEEPPLPSVRLKRDLTTLAETAAARQLEPAKLNSVVKGELDWIVMKSLDKDRSRRYESASSLAADVQRHLSGEPVLAAPPSAGYRVRKFVRRNRGPVIAGGAVAAALLIGLAGTTWQWREAARARAKEVARADESSSIAMHARAVVQEVMHSLGVAAEPVPLGKQLYESFNSAGPLSDGTVLPKISQERSDVLVLGATAKWAAQQLIDKAAAAEWSAYTANLALAQAAVTSHDYAEARRRASSLPPSKLGWEGRFVSHLAKSVLWAVTGAEGRTVGFAGDRLVLAPWEDKAEARAWIAVSGIPVAPSAEELPTQRMPVFNDAGQLQTAIAPTPRVWPQAATNIVTRLFGAAYLASFDESGTLVAWHRSAMDYPDLGPSAVLVAEVGQWGGPARKLWSISPNGVALSIAPILASSPNGPSGLTITTPDGTRRIVGGADKTVRFYEAKDGKPTLPEPQAADGSVTGPAPFREVAVFRMPAAVTNLQMTGDGTRLIIHLQDGSARVWDIRDPEDRRKDLQAEWAERVPAGAYLDMLWASNTPDDTLRDAVINDASLTPLRRLVAAEMLEERLEDDRWAAEEAFTKMKQAAAPDGVPPAADAASITSAVRAAAAAADMPKRVKARVIALAAAWQYRQPEATTEQKLAEENKQRRVAEADLVMQRLLQPSEELGFRWPTELEQRSAVKTYSEVLGEGSAKAIRARFALAKMLLATKPEEGADHLERASEAASKLAGSPSAETIEMWGVTATQLALLLKFDKAERWYAELARVVPEMRKLGTMPRFIEVLLDGQHMQWTESDLMPFDRLLQQLRSLKGPKLHREVYEALARASWTCAMCRFPSVDEGRHLWTNAENYATRALTLDDARARPWHALALARVRLERRVDALDAMQRRDQIVSKEASGIIDVIVVAMIRHHLSTADDTTLAAVAESDGKPGSLTGGQVLDRDGHRAAGVESLTKARALMSPAPDGTPSPWADDADAQALLAEAEALFGAANP